MIPKEKVRWCETCWFEAPLNIYIWISQFSWFEIRIIDLKIDVSSLIYSISNGDSSIFQRIFCFTRCTDEDQKSQTIVFSWKKNLKLYEIDFFCSKFFFAFFSEDSKKKIFFRSKKNVLSINRACYQCLLPDRHWLIESLRYKT